MVAPPQTTSASYFSYRNIVCGHNTWESDILFNSLPEKHRNKPRKAQQNRQRENPVDVRSELALVFLCFLYNPKELFGTQKEGTPSLLVVFIRLLSATYSINSAARAFKPTAEIAQ